ncbi:MAG TPA: DUF4270 family protein [Mucilaginibacter sp.]|nr:DUF4270 family protein [Mucilaginibacter sp.]
MLISLFILNGCKNQDTVGVGINSTNQLNSGFTDTSTIVINTDTIGSLVTTGLAKNPLGYFIDPIFGTSVSSLATDINLPGQAGYTPPTGTITIDSARLVLGYAAGFYGDSITSSYTVNVYQLAEKFNVDSAYYNTKKWKINGNTLLGTKTFNARPHDSIKVFNIINGAPDTLIKVPPQIRIPISNSFINTNLFNLSATQLSSNSDFQNIVNGLYITVDRTKSTGAGGILMFNGADTLAVYYHSVSGTTIDTAQISLPIAHMSSSIQHTFTTVIQNELTATQNKAGSRPTFYLQGLAGLRAKISFPNFMANLRSGLLKKDSDILINRAELVITPQPGSYIPYQPLPKITMYQLDLANQPSLIQDASSVDVRSGGVNTFGGFYDSSLNEYHFILTAYLQDLLFGRVIGYGTYIAPIDNANTTSVDILPTVQVAARTVAVGTNLSSPYRIKLNVIYTKIAKQ